MGRPPSPARRTAIAASLAAALCGLAAAFGVPGATAAEPDVPAALAPFEPFVDKTWKGLVDAEKEVYDVARWERAIGGQAIRIVHSVADGAYGGETIVTWDRSREALVYTYFTTAGFFTRGTMWFDEAGRLHSSETVEGHQGGVTEVQATQEVLAGGRLAVRTRMLRDGVWEERGEVVYRVDPTAEVVLPGEEDADSECGADSAAEALSRLALAQAAIGTAGDLAAFGPFEIEATGTLDKSAEGQGFSPEAPSSGPYAERFAVDPAADRIAWEYREDRYDGTFEAFREAYPAPDERLYVVHDPPLAIPARSPRFREARRRLQRRLPHLALAELAGRAPRLCLLSADASGARVVGALEDGTLLSAEIDAEGLLRSLIYVAHLSGKGDTEVTWWFDDYREVDGLGLLPFRYGSTVGGQRYTDMTVRSVHAAGPEPFEAPPAYRRLPEQRGDETEPRPLELEEIFSGVFRVPEVRSGFAPLVVAFEDFVVAVDAPASFPILGKIPAEETDPAPFPGWHSRRLAEAIERAFPQRALRYLVLTHAHEDHAGGVRALVDAGATVLAHPTVRPVVERLLTLRPPAGAPTAAEDSASTLRFEAVTEPRVIEDRRQRLEILPLGDNPHAEGLLVLHLPAHEALFVSDLVTPEPLDVYPREAHAALDRFLARWIAESGLDIERVLSMHGSPVATSEHLERARQSP